MNRKFMTLVVVGLLAFGVQLSLLVDSFPGFHGSGDCNLCHNLPASAYSQTYENSEITLDGNTTELFWDGDNTYGRKVMVPVASQFGGVHTFIEVIFAQNTTHLFILANWEDATIDGTDTMKHSDSDGFSIMFNNNMKNFDGAFFSGMSTDYANETVDVMTFKPKAAATGTEIFGNDYTHQEITANTMVYDQVMTSSGLAEDTTSNVAWGAMHGNISDHNEHNYQIELARPLETGDADDVQFDESRYYQFSIAVFNASSGADHWVSPVHQVFVYNQADPNNNNINIVDYEIDVVTVTETETKTETEGKSPISFLPIMLALIAIPGIIVARRRQ